MADEPDYYATLGVRPDADDETIRQAYRRLAWEYHPDRAGAESAAKMSRLNVAYQVLGDPERRRQYDAQHPAIIPQRAPTQVATAARANQQMAARDVIRSVSPGPLRLINRFEGDADASLTSISFTHDGLFVGGGIQDGRALIWSLHAGRLAHTLTYGAQGAGVLQELRLSPRGTLAAAWGGLLGLRVWAVSDGQTIWNTSVRAPVGSMDAILLDDPPLVRLATPDAPLAMANDDPIRFAEQGRRATAVFARPLVGQVSPVWATPFRCVEGGNEGLLREPPGADWRTQWRRLSSDGAFLLTFASGAAPRFGKGSYLRLWSLLSKTLLGATEPKRIEQIMEPPGILHPPLAATHDLAWLAVGGANRHVRLFALRAHQQRIVEIGPLPHDALLALTPDGGRLALARETRLDLYETRSQKTLQTWEYTAPITSLMYSAHAGHPLLGVGLRNGVMELWAE
ncbi:MAG TPA: DnaJ domain-containing protein [Ktedonobacterales bacterium]|nr:DnaJ domain-containing protein [Ktedonobacterales bacterium]